MALDLANLLRCLLVAATQPASADSNPEGIAADTHPMTERSSNRVAVSEDRGEERYWYRTIVGLTSLFGLAPLITGIIAASQYVDAETDVSKANRVYALRFVFYETLSWRLPLT